MISIKQLKVTYHSEFSSVKAVNDISFKLSKNESVGIMGESGCGKTSVAHAIMGLLTHARVQGIIDCDSVNLLSLSRKEWQAYRWKKIAIVFQNSLDALNPVLTIGEQIAEPIQTHICIGKKDIHEQVIHLMEQVGLSPELIYQYPHQLSGGMRQRVLIAMALSCKPEYLIIDEPTSALDPETSDHILSLIKKLQYKQGFSMLMISHQLSAIQRMTDRLITLYAGQIVEDGPTQEVLSNPMHGYTRGLINASPEFFSYKDLWGFANEPPLHNDSSGCVFYSRCCQREERCQQSCPQLRSISKARKIACHKGGIETFLRAENISKTFHVKKKSIKALKNIDITIKSGEIVSLVGRSGSGKSTLAHILVNILTPDTGKVIYANLNQSKKQFCSMNGIEIVFQDPFSAINERLSILDIVCEPLNVLKWQTYDNRKAAALDCLKKVQLSTASSFIKRPVSTLSGGQRQRLAIARSLVTQPKLLIADEITSMLDASTSANIIRVLRTIQNQSGFAMLYITHDLFLARKIADKFYVMHDGEIVESGAAFNVIDHPKHPMTQLMLNSIRN
ncbi:MAG: peptide/nickel transport system ATP-binding protein [Candidatus Magnetoglobus multicellularis str. Araruama]|uniref:Peptide/nickel transport system ATP-binding protein n=1 Tax=Candidatus Magnetoglobus multicellularis str. Araruama TaxID=890399 RepID=A0A1V1PA06_9BACT|nr:MAG: peptide/nickel transport system ATP-binding protein [Candidatus Magnetoglobus multicellularis str. Araruama]